MRDYIRREDVLALLTSAVEECKRTLARSTFVEDLADATAEQRAALNYIASVKEIPADPVAEAAVKLAEAVDASAANVACTCGSEECRAKNAALDAYRRAREVSP